VLDDVGVSFPAGPKVTSPPKKQDWLHGPMSSPTLWVLGGFFSQRASGWGMRLTFHLCQCHYVSTPITCL